MINLDWVVRFDYEAKLPGEVNPPENGTFIRPVSNSDDVLKYTSRFEVHKLVQGKKEIDLAKVLARTEDTSFMENPSAFLRDVLNGNVDFRSKHSSPQEIYQGILRNVATIVSQIENKGERVRINKEGRIIVDHLTDSIYVAARAKNVVPYYITGVKEQEKAHWPQPNGCVRMRRF
jgi:hypothetical protein